MTPTPAAEETVYSGDPVSLSALQHEINHPMQGAVDPSLMRAYLTAGVASVISVFPLPRTSVLPYCGRLTLAIPAARKDRILVRKMEPRRMAVPVQDLSVQEWTDEAKAVPTGQGYVMLQVTDTFQWILDVTSRDKHSFIATPVKARIVAEALAEDWSRGLSAGMGTIGIGVYNPEGASIEIQAARLRKSQEDAFTAKIRQADLAHSAGRLNEITDFHRVAAEWMGVERPWFKPIFEVVTKFCPGCTERIPQGSKRCRYCQLDLVEWYQRQYRDHARIEELDPVVYAHLMDTGKIVTKKT